MQTSLNNLEQLIQQYESVRTTVPSQASFKKNLSWPIKGK